MGFMDSVKEIAGKVSTSVEKGAKSVSESSKKFSEKNKIKHEINQLEMGINQAYVAIGKAYFEKNKDKSDPEFADFIADIIQKTEKCNKLKENLNAMEDKLFCTECGAVISKNQKFCDNCGTKVDIPETTTEDTDVVDVRSEDITEVNNDNAE